MHNKTIAAGALFLLAILAPAAMGHSERAVFAGDLGSGYAGPGTGIANSVSGRYVGAAGPAVAIEAYNNPQGTRAVFATLCDAEVVVDSKVAPDNAGNEPLVDGVFGGTSPAGEVWDDGGLGVACHTANYSTAGFNTFGCQPGTRAAGGSHVGTDIWVGASCDWKTDQGGGSGQLVFLACLISGGLALNVGNLVNDVLGLTQCAVEYVACLIDPNGCAVGGTEVCGADTFVDATNYGLGSGLSGGGPSFHARRPALPSLSRYASSPGHETPPYPPPPPPPSSDGGADFPDSPNSVTNGNPPVTTACTGQETALIAVFDTVATNGGGVNNPGTPEVYPALTGELWSAPATVGSALLPPCQDATPSTPVVVQTACMHPTLGVQSPWVDTLP